MVTIDDIRKHCNVDFDDDDSYISDLIKVAEVAVANVINTPLDTYVQDGEMPAPLDHAVKLIVANLYENREPVSYGKATNVAFTLGFLLSPYIVLT